MNVLTVNAERRDLGHSRARGVLGVLCGGVAWVVLTAAILCGAAIVDSRVSFKDRLGTALWIMAPAACLVGGSVASVRPVKVRSSVLRQGLLRPHSQACQPTAADGRFDLRTPGGPLIVRAISHRPDRKLSRSGRSAEQHISRTVP